WGRRSSSAGADEEAMNRRMLAQASRRIFTGSPRERRIGDHVGDVVQDDVRLRVAEDQGPSDEAVTHLLGQRGQLAQERGRHGRERRAARIDAVDAKRDRLLYFLSGIR